jgi:hypothetical protein
MAEITQTVCNIGLVCLSLVITLVLIYCYGRSTECCLRVYYMLYQVHS